LGTRFAALGEYLSEQILVDLTLSCRIQNIERAISVSSGPVPHRRRQHASKKVIDLAADHEVLRSQRVPQPSNDSGNGFRSTPPIGSARRPRNGLDPSHRPM
jgi:hypothetical protein